LAHEASAIFRITFLRQRVEVEEAVAMVWRVVALFGKFRCLRIEKLEGRARGPMRVGAPRRPEGYFSPWDPVAGLSLTPTTTLPSSHSHSTELATAAQYNQSLRLKSTVENACCRKGV
jgi:hypothetical protein